MSATTPIRRRARAARPFDYSGPIDTRLPPLERVESVTVAAQTVVVPFDLLRRHPVLNFAVEQVPAVALFDPRVRTALGGARMARARLVGAAAAFDRRLAGRVLDFRAAGAGAMVDHQTGSRWDLTGRAVAGPLRSAQLRPLPDLNAFWFAVAAFLPHAQLASVR